MHVMFEVFLAPGATGDGLVTEETLRDTQAQIMTEAEATQIGFSGLPDDPEGRDRRFIVCAQSDARRIHNQLEMCGQVAAFRMHEVSI